MAGRRRETLDPYRILVSEIMLQQSQVDRVLPYYKKFLKLFPTLNKLAQAKLSDVLRVWQGLGYNRRALYLHKIAQATTAIYRSGLPNDVQKLKALPGVGDYTAKAVRVFAFNEPEVLIETNIRTVFLHEFFKNGKNIPDGKIIPLIEKSLDHRNPREWYYALMDYGSHVKKVFGNPNLRSKHYSKQSKFRGSLRQERGRILRELLTSPLSQKNINSIKTKEAVRALIKDGLVKKEKTSFRLL